MKVFLCVFLCAMVIAKAANVGPDRFYDQYKEDWENFKEKFQKTYENEVEEKFRMKVFSETKYYVDQHNERFKKGLETYTVGINKFSDLLPHEVPTGNLNQPPPTESPVASTESPVTSTEKPSFKF